MKLRIVGFIKSTAYLGLFLALGMLLTGYEVSARTQGANDPLPQAPAPGAQQKVPQTAYPVPMIQLTPEMIQKIKDMQNKPVKKKKVHPPYKGYYIDFMKRNMHEWKNGNINTITIQPNANPQQRIAYHLMTPVDAFMKQPLTLKEFKITGATTFDLNMTFWLIYSWDGETLSLLANGKPFAKYQHSFRQHFHILNKNSRCKTTQGHAKSPRIPWNSTQVQCTFKGEVKDGKLFIEGKDVTHSSKDPFKFDFGVRSTLDQPMPDEGWGLQTFQIKPTGTPSSAQPEATPQQGGYNFTFVVPMGYGGFPMQPASSYPKPAEGAKPTVAEKPKPPSGPTKMDPQFFDSFSALAKEEKLAADYTAGFPADAMEKAKTACAKCRVGNKALNAEEIKWCNTKCVLLPREVVINMDKQAKSGQAVGKTPTANAAAAAVKSSEKAAPAA